MKINKATWDLLPAALKESFKPNAANPDEYDNGEENAAGLKSALEKERAEVQRVAQERDAFKASKDADIAKARKEALEEARTKGDFAAIEKDYQRQVKEAQDAAKTAAQRADQLAIDSANEAAISGLLPAFVSATAGRAILAGRVKTELVDGKPVTRFLDPAGSPTALDAEGFKKNLLAEADLKPILVASKGSGGGATHPTGGGGSTSVERPKDAATADPATMVAFLKSKGVGSEG